MAEQIGLNVGGSMLSAMIVSGRKCLHEMQRPVPRDYNTLIEACAEMVQTCEAYGRKVTQVGVAVSGIVDPQNQQVSSFLLPYLNGRYFQEDLAEAVEGKKVMVVNDANAAVQLEAAQGKGRGHDTVLGLILDAGVGSGYVVDGKVQTGRSGMIAEVGLTPMPPFAEYQDMMALVCEGSCRHSRDRLIIGDVLSESGLSKLSQIVAGKPATVGEIVEGVKAKDPQIKRVMNRYSELAAISLSSIIHILDPHIVVVSGSVSAIPGLSPNIAKHLHDTGMSPFRRIETPVVPAKLGPNASLRGAALLAKTAG